MELNQKYLKNEYFGFKLNPNWLVTNHNPKDLFSNLCFLECTPCIKIESKKLKEESVILTIVLWNESKDVNKK